MYENKGAIAHRESRSPKSQTPDFRNLEKARKAVNGEIVAIKS
jgi:hypothetical protein